MAASLNKRVKKELDEMMKSSDPSYRIVKVDENNVFLWHVLLLPEKVPYDKGAFKIEVLFPNEYPFKPPKITFITKVYHPNVDEKGQVCLSIIASDNWKPATKIEQVTQSLVGLLNNPEPDHPLRPELSKEYMDNRNKFLKKAEEFTIKYGEKRT